MTDDPGADKLNAARKYVASRTLERAEWRGAGTPPGNLKLVSSTISTTGVVMATYQQAGAIAYGSFALEEPTPAEVERRRQLGS